MSTQFTRSQNTWMAYILLSLYSYFINILGPITPFLHDEFHLSYAVSSLHLSAFAAGILAVGLMGDRVIRRTGRRRALAIGAIGMGLGALLLVFGRSPLVTVSATFLMGWVGSLILAVVPVTLSDEHGEQRGVAISEANMLASLLATIAPLLVGWFAATLAGWRMALIIVAVLAVLIGALLFRPDPRQPAPAPSSQAGGRLPFLFWYYWVIILLAVSVEFCMIGWSADYLGSQLALPKAQAAQAVSLFFGGMIAGRWITSRVLRSFTERSVVLVSLFTGAAGFLLFWGAASLPAALAGLAVAGLGVAGLYPLVMSLAIAASGQNQAQAGARITFASGAAILCLPLLLGQLADMAGLRPAFSVVAVLFALMLLLMVLSRLVPRSAPAAVSIRNRPVEEVMER